MGAKDADSDKYGRHRKFSRNAGGNKVYLIIALFFLGLLWYLSTPYETTVVTGTFKVDGGTFERLDVEIEQTTGRLEDSPVISSRTKSFSKTKTSKDEDGLLDSYPRYENGAEGSKSEDMILPSDPSLDISDEDANDSQAKSSVVEEEEEVVSQGGNGDEYGMDGAEESDIFVDQAEYDNAPFIKVLPESKTRKYSRIVLAHERYFRHNPSKLYIPTLKKNSGLTLEQFKHIFMDKSQPVVIPFEAMRHLNNFTTKAGWTLEELKELYPNSVPALYKYGALIKKDIDIGPAVSSLMSNKKLRKTQVGKSYPRNTKFVLNSLKALNLQPLPFIPPDFKMMLPSLWFASTAEATPLHSDCCDNWAMQISGTKKWYIAPPNEARVLKPKCAGGLCWVKSMPHADEHAATRAQQRLRDNTQIIHVDVPPGHVLYLPAGWFHHVEQEVPTIMTNFWSKEGPAFLHYLRRKKAGSAEARAAGKAEDDPQPQEDHDDDEREEDDDGRVPISST